MALLPVENVGTVGIIVDQPAHDIPPEGWSGGKNVSFRDGAVLKALGQGYIYNTLQVAVQEALYSYVIPSGTQDWEYTVRNDIDRTGETLVVGTPWKATEWGAQAGSAHAYQIVNGEAINEQELPRSDGAANDSYGGCVKISADGQTIFVGARRYNSERGAVFVYTLVNGVWTEQDILEPSGPDLAYRFFGIHFDCTDDGNKVIIGAPRSTADTEESYCGFVFVFERSGSGVWSQAQKIELSPLANNQYFGMCCAISGDGRRAFAGWKETATSPQGRVAVIVPTVDAYGTFTWPANPTSILTASDAATGDNFGFALGSGGSPVDYWSANPIHVNQDGSVLGVGAWGVNANITGPYLFATTAQDGDFTNVGAATHLSGSGTMRITGSDGGTNNVELGTTNTMYGNTNEAIDISIDLIQGLTANVMTIQLWDSISTTWTTIGSSASNTTITYTLNKASGSYVQFTWKLRFYLASGGGSDYFDIDNVYITNTNGGAVYIFNDTGGGTYSEVQKVEPVTSNTSETWIGWNISLDDTGTILAAGGYGLNVTGAQEGGVWLFFDDGTGFTEVNFFQETTPVAYREFGYEVVLSGDGRIMTVNELADATSSTGDGYYGHARTHIYAVGENVVPIAPHFLLPWRTTSDIRWIFAGEEKVYYTNGVANTDITRYTTTPGDNDYDAGSRPVWTGGVLHGIPFLNNDNGVDYPQAWNSATSRLYNMPNWPANVYCKVMRNFKNFIIALDVTNGATRDPFRVKWSSSAEPGALPASWDETDDTYNTGEASVSESQNTGGFLIDCAPLQDSNILYKGDSIWSMDLVSADRVFSINKRSGEAGLLAPGCVRSFFGTHFVVGYNDVYLFDGNSPRSIIKKRMRRWLYNNIHKDYVAKTRVVPDYRRQEMLIAFVEGGATSTYLTKALIWNWDEDTWTIRDLPEIAYLENGLVAGSDSTFDDLPGVFDDLSFPMGGDDITPAQTEILMARAYLEQQLIRMNVGYTDRGNAYESFVERRGLAITGQGQQGRPKVDPSKRVIVRGLYPKIFSETNPILEFYVGGQEHPNGPVQWQGPEYFQVGVDVKVNCMVNTPYIAYRIRDEGTEGWQMSGLHFDLDLISMR